MAKTTKRSTKSGPKYRVLSPTIHIFTQETILLEVPSTSTGEQLAGIVLDSQFAEPGHVGAVHLVDGDISGGVVGVLEERGVQLAKRTSFGILRRWSTHSEERRDRGLALSRGCLLHNVSEVSDGGESSRLFGRSVPEGLDGGRKTPQRNKGQRDGLCVSEK